MKNLNLSGINFWLEADQEKIDFETIDVTKKENKKLIDEKPQYIMEQAIILLPHFPKSFHYNYLCLKNDQNISQAFNETNEDEWFEQAIWYWKDRAWSIGIHIESNEEWSSNRTAFRDNGLAAYYDINDTLVNKLYFEIICKDAIEYRKNIEKYLAYIHSSEKFDQPVFEDNSLFFPMDAMHELMLTKKETSTN